MRLLSVRQWLLAWSMVLSVMACGSDDDGVRPIDVFTATQTVVLQQAGDLPSLMGTDATQWTRIERLAIVGPMNGTDLRFLRHLLSTHNAQNEGRVLGVRHLDLSAATICAGGEPYYRSGEQSGDEVSNTYYLSSYYSEDNTVGRYLFFHVDSLESLVLPRTTVQIASHAFDHCHQLRQIDIPDGVHTIGCAAFINCDTLSQIRIAETSQLHTVDGYAFATGHKLESIFLPSGIVHLNSRAFAGLMATEIHLRWISPPLIAIPPVTKNSTLYVPRGSAQAYQADAEWGRFDHIVEE